MGIALITNNILSDSGVTIGAANGVATLDAGGKIPVSQLPNSVMEFKGTWSAATNTPTLANGTGNAGDVYEVSAAGTVNFGAGGIAFAVGDYVVYDGATWQYSSGQKGTITSLTFSAPLTGGTITTSGTVGIPAATSTVDGYLSATDWTTFNGKQAALSGTGFVKISGTTISYDNSTYYLASNPSGFTSNIGTVTSVSGTGTVSGLTLSGTVTTSGSLTLGGTLSLTSGQVTTALGFTPYSNTNPSGFITSSGTAAAINQTVGAGSEANLVYSQIADNDFFRIRVGGSSNAGWAEIATADDGTEPIYVRQYTGTFSSIARTATLLDGSGNTSFPGTVTAPTFSGSLSGNAATATNSSQLGGYGPNQTGGANTIVQRDSNGYIQNSYFYTSGGGSERGTGISYVAGFNSSDYYIRSYTLQGLASAMSGASMNISGTATTATNLFGQGTIQRTSSGESYSTMIQVRETSGASGNTNIIYAPALGFHWGGVVASSIRMNAGGEIQIVNNPGTSYEAFRAGTITANSFSGPGTGLTGTASSLNVGYATSAGNADTVDGYHGSNYLGKNGNSYYQADTWIQVNANTGIYWPGYYGLHLYPNQSSYGPLQINGSKNGWTGIYFEYSANSLMMNGNESGHHNNGYGWQFRWYNGTLYCSKNAYGGGSEGVVLDSSNSPYAYNMNQYVRTSDTPTFQQVYSNDYFRSYGNSGWYNQSYSQGIRNNTGNTSYGTVMTLGGGTNGWNGYTTQNNYTCAWMHDSSGNNGFYQENGRGWILFFNYGNNCWGIGTDNTYSGDGFRCIKYGSAEYGWTTWSDRRAKENISNITGALDIVLGMRGVYYNYIKDEAKSQHVGFIAQELMEVLPQSVRYAEEIDEYNINYGPIVSVLAEAIKEQQNEINELKLLVNQLLTK